MIKAVIFDLDDTLVPEEQYVKSGYYHIARILEKKLNYSKENLYNLLIRLFKSSPQKVFNRLYETLGISYKEADILNLVEEYRNHYPSINYFEDVIDCIEDLKKNNIKLGIITDGYRNSQYQKIRAIKANEQFHHIIVTDDLGREYWKPHPKPFEMMKEKLNVRFNEMVYIGDNPEKDFYIKSTYPIKTIRIFRDNGVHKNKPYFNSTKEDYKINNLTELHRLIYNL
ncbi:HAD family hydrolase [Oceanobacillus caeni]|uniref:Haloacid dehalogenase n=1 Tax=Oceanobacillus caeni TaxID=405946 RepID=A0ABR5MKA6_9BACI|nr:HAD-IA family hydrolase [Oceanobacillus caeni]KPH75933.1 hypothetical protein AFL42_07805 [Oceanobacillus caeni]